LKSNETKISSVVIPLHNEIVIVSPLATSIKEFCQSNSEIVFLLICDNCTDGTYEKLHSTFANNDQVMVLSNQGKKGYGSALRFGFSRSYKLGFEWAIAIDSDLSNPLSEVKKIHDWILSKKKIELSKYAIIKGNRFSNVIPSFKSVPFYRLLLSTSANKLSKFLVLGASSDPTNGFRAVNLKWYIAQSFEEVGFESIMEEVYFAIKDRKLIADVTTELRYDQALRPESSFTLNQRTFRGYLRYLFLAFRNILTGK
jgi:glycosyltransferase involved in cell wall biosynthesis